MKLLARGIGPLKPMLREWVGFTICHDLRDLLCRLLRHIYLDQLPLDSDAHLDVIGGDRCSGMRVGTAHNDLDTNAIVDKPATGPCNTQRRAAVSV